jgi:hypothetical protein
LVSLHLNAQANIDLILVAEKQNDDGQIGSNEFEKCRAMRRISTLTDTAISDFVRYKFLLDEQKPADGTPPTGMAVGGYYECDHALDIGQMLSSGQCKIWIRLPILTFDVNGREVNGWALAAMEPDNEPRLLCGKNIMNAHDNYAPFTDSWCPLASTASTSRLHAANLFPDLSAVQFPNQPADRSTYRHSAYQSTDLFASPSTDECADQAGNQPTCLSTVRCTSHSAHRHSNQYANLPANRYPESPADRSASQSVNQSADSCPLIRTAELLTSTFLIMKQKWQEERTNSFASSLSHNQNTENSNAVVTNASSCGELLNVSVDNKEFKNKLLDLMSADPPASVIKRTNLKNNFYFVAIHEHKPKLSTKKIRIDKDLSVYLVPFKVSATGLDALYTLLRKSKSDSWMVHPQNQKYSLFTGEIDYDYREKLKNFLVE